MSKAGQKLKFHKHESQLALALTTPDLLSEAMRMHNKEEGTRERTSSTQVENKEVGEMMTAMQQQRGKETEKQLM